MKNKLKSKTSDIEIELEESTFSFYSNLAKKEKTTPEKLMSGIVNQYAEQASE